MSAFFFMLLAGAGWMGLSGEISWIRFAVGVGLGAAIWRLQGAVAHRPFSPRRAAQLVALGAWLGVSFLRELVTANLQQLRIVLAPRVDVQPGWIRFRTGLETPAMRALLGMMLALTPGSLTYDERQLADGGWTIGVHALDVRTEAELVRRIRARLEAPLRRIESL